MPDSQLIKLIFEPGFSSKERVTEISGRGIGMDAVKASVDNVGGKIRVISQVDEGTTFVITLPLYN